MSARRPHQGGQSLVELALVVPILVLLVMGTVEIGRALFAYVILEEAAQEGATYASREPADMAGIRARVMTSSNHPEVTGATVPNAVCDNVAGTISVTATYPLPLVTPVGRALFGGGLPHSATFVATNLEHPDETCP